MTFVLLLRRRIHCHTWLAHNGGAAIGAPRTVVAGAGRRGFLTPSQHISASCVSPGASLMMVSSLQSRYFVKARNLQDFEGPPEQEVITLDGDDDDDDTYSQQEKPRQKETINNSVVDKESASPPPQNPKRKFYKIYLQEMDKFLRQKHGFSRHVDYYKKSEFYYDKELNASAATKIEQEGGTYYPTYLRVYSSISTSSGKARPSGSDAIRVVLLDHNKKLIPRKSPPVLRIPTWEQNLGKRIQEMTPKLGWCEFCGRHKEERTNGTSGKVFLGCFGYRSHGADQCRKTWDLNGDIQIKVSSRTLGSEGV